MEPWTLRIRLRSVIVFAHASGVSLATANPEGVRGVNEGVFR
jgi:hypothetical protein